MYTHNMNELNIFWEQLDHELALFKAGDIIWSNSHSSVLFITPSWLAPNLKITLSLNTFYDFENFENDFIITLTNVPIRER